MVELRLQAADKRRLLAGRGYDGRVVRLEDQLDVAKSFDTTWIEDLIYKITLLNFLSYIVHTISSYLRDRTFEASFYTATSYRRGMRAGVTHGGFISPVLFSLYVNDIPPPSHHVELALYVDDTAIIATSR